MHADAARAWAGGGVPRAIELLEHPHEKLQHQGLPLPERVLGHRSSDFSSLQDDVAIIAAKLASYTGGDGFRTDDVPGELAQARPLSLDDGVQIGAGIITALRGGYKMFGRPLSAIPLEQSASDRAIHVLVAIHHHPELRVNVDVLLRALLSASP